MRTSIILLVLLVIFMALPDLLSASAGSSSFIFLRISAGSRPAALGEAVTASGADITSAFYNPALLQSFEGRNQVAFMYNSYFKDVTQNYLALASKGKNFSLGGYLALGNVADIERWTNPDTASLVTFEENNFIGAFSFSYGFNKFDLGLSLKYAYEKMDYASAGAYMIDAGVFMPISKELSAGVAAKNFGNKVKFITESYSLSREFRAGLSYKPQHFQQSLELVSDAVFYSDIDTKVNFGAEYKFNRSFALRAGYGTGYDSRGISFGGGVFYRQFKFDYAFVGYKNDLGTTHRFTIGAIF